MARIHSLVRAFAVAVNYLRETRARRKRGSELARLEVGQYVLDLTLFKLQSSPQQEGYTDELKRIYRRVTGAQWEGWRSGHELNEDVIHELRQIRTGNFDTLECPHCKSIVKLKPHDGRGAGMTIHESETH